jgi:hypothetical protein
MSGKNRRADFLRSISAICGLVAGLSLMWTFGLGGVLYGFVFGATGAVIGGSIGDRLTGGTAKAVES